MQNSKPTDAPQRVSAGRLVRQPAEAIDRSETIHFKFNGKLYPAHPGDTIGSALMAAGVRVVSRSFKYHRPRAWMCCSGHCPNCLVNVGDEPNVRACTRPVADGMDVTSQNVWPSVESDVWSLTSLVEPFLPAGFYYKTFMRPQFMWPVYERFLRLAAGLGKVNPKTPHEHFDKQYRHADVTVVGAGPAGLHAALAAAEQGARVLLVDDNLALGGHVRYASERGVEPLADVIAAVETHPNIAVLADTTVLGWYEDHWMSAMTGNRLIKIRSRALVVAMGVIEQPLVFENNDLPGVMLASGVARLLHVYGVVPGTRVTLVTANDDGWQVAAQLVRAGVIVAAVADERGEFTSDDVAAVAASGAELFWGHTISSANGSGAVREAVLAPLDGHGGVNLGATRYVSCDLIALSVGWMANHGLLYQAGGELVYNEARGEILPAKLPEGVYAAGRVDGSHSLAGDATEGRLAGQQAAAYLGYGAPPAQSSLDEAAAARALLPPRTSTLIKVPGSGKRFVCFCEDVSDKDLKVSIEEGFNTMELLKRYSTVTMGPCQGRMCSMNTIHLCARANGWTVAETGTTTARPPMSPVKLGALAGQNMEPVALTSIHEWHLEHDAKMMVAGVWMRPEYYGSDKRHAAEEVRAVRERVGMIDVSTLGKLRLTGRGVPNLLDRIYINKWQKLGVGRVRYGVMCNDEGIVLDDGVTAHLDDLEWYMTTTSSGASSIFEWIQWWMQSGWGDDVHLVNVTEVNAAFNVAGPRARDLLAKLTDEEVTNAAFPYMHARAMSVAGAPCTVLRIGFTGELSYEVHCPAAYGLSVWEAIMEAGAEFGILPFGVEAQRVLRLEKAHIIVGQDTDALSDPISADMEWAVKLDKPEFLGNRPLARVKEQGPKQRLTGFKMVTPGIVPEEGLQIVHKTGSRKMDIIGWVTSSRRSPTLGEAIGMCWLPAELAETPGARFTIRVDEGTLAEAQVHHGAFYDPEGSRLKM